MSSAPQRPQRVVVTGGAGLSPIGSDWATVRRNLRACCNGVVRFDEWRSVDGLHSLLGAPVDFETPAQWPRKIRRSLGRVSAMAVRATRAIALEISAPSSGRRRGFAG